MPQLWPQGVFVLVFMDVVSLLHSVTFPKATTNGGKTVCFFNSALWERPQLVTMFTVYIMCIWDQFGVNFLMLRAQLSKMQL